MKTPDVEVYDDVHVFREDKLFPFPSPNFSKIRGIKKHIETLDAPNICILDTIMSRCGWGLSYICKDINKQVYNFYSKRKQGIDFYRAMSESFGAVTVPIMGTHQRIAKIFAENWLKKKGITDYHFIPSGLSVQEKIDEHMELVGQLPRELLSGSLICCISSATIFSGLLKGLIKFDLHPDFYGVQAHTWKNRDDVIRSKAIIPSNRSLISDGNYHTINWKVIDLGFEYLQTVKERPPFPCDLYLDRKAWVFLKRFKHKLKKPISFWNIGGEWSPDFGLEGDLRGDGITTKEEIKEYLKNAGSTFSI